MSRLIVYALMFVLTLSLQASLVASLPAPYLLFPLALVVGLVVLHERSLALGTLWIVASGVILEVRGLSQGSSLASSLSAIVALVLVTSVFAKKSFWALLGIGAGAVGSYVVVQLLWLAGLSATKQTDLAINTLLANGLKTFLLALVGLFIFGAYARRLIRWFRDKFRRPASEYEAI